MSITQISLIGIDHNSLFRSDIDGVDIFTLEDLSIRAVELGVLYSKNKQGIANRHPTIDIVKAIGRKYGHNHQLALHLCGEVVAEYVSDPPSLNAITEGYSRIQLNFNAKKDANSDKFKILLEKLTGIVKNGSVPIVLQYKECNKNLIEALISQIDNSTNLHILFDSSGGYGKVLENPLPAIEGFYCGYAGGISPDTITNVLSRVNDVNTPATAFYIDMESGIRDDSDLFSVSKSLAVIEYVNRSLM